MTHIREIPFLEEFREDVIKGKKTFTTRSKRYGEPGDTFDAFGRTFKLINVNKRTLRFVRDYLYGVEGCSSPEEFERVWVKIHPRRGFVPDDKKWVHSFIEVK